jgi:hypothetical protein
MKAPTFRDVEQLSAYLDGQLSEVEKSRLEARLKSDPALAALLGGLRQARTVLQRTPKRRAPRNFTLTPKMAGIRPPVPRVVPALSWASAVAMVLFLFTLGTNLLGQLPASASAPMVDHYVVGGRGGGPAATSVPAEAAPATAAPATLAPVNSAGLETPTPEFSVLMAPQPTQSGTFAAPSQTAAPKLSPKPANSWLFIWPGLAAVLIGAALFVRWRTDRAFKRKNKSG